MFQFKNGSGSDEPSLANKLPNFHGKVRTFKEDTENFEKGTSGQPAVAEENRFSPPAEKTISYQQQPSAGEQSSQPQPISPRRDAQTENPFQSMPTPPPVSSPEPDLSALKPSSSQSFFSEKPAPAESIFPPQTETQPSPQKPKKTIFVSLAILLTVIIAAAGFYYYWFNMRSASPATSSVPAAPTPAPSTSSAPAEPQNKNLHQLVVDTSSPSGIIDAIQKFANDFANSASNGDLAEVKLLDKNNQPISKDDFLTELVGLAGGAPNGVTMKLSEDYSLFVKKEGGAAKLGLVFKTVTSSGLADEMKNWEPTIITDLNSLYLDQVLSPTTGTFDSAKYKNADIRYFNFSSPTDTSLDYSVISNFLVIGTSKDMTRATLDYMSEK